MIERDKMETAISFSNSPFFVFNGRRTPSSPVLKKQIFDLSLSSSPSSSASLKFRSSTRHRAIKCSVSPAAETAAGKTSLNFLFCIAFCVFHQTDVHMLFTVYGKICLFLVYVVTLKVIK